MQLNRNFLIVCGVLVLSIAAATATHPQFRTFATFEELLKGDSEGVSITSEGTLLLSPAFVERLDTEEAFVYDMAAGPTGTLYLATGNSGKIFRIPTTGEGEELAKLSEPGVYAIAVGSNSQVFAATGPDGKVYKISSDGSSEVFYEPGEKYIWDLAIDKADNLYVATGPRGIIYKVSPEGSGTEFYDSEEAHVVSLNWALNQDLLAGTAPGGLLLRLNSSGRPFVLYDSTLEEVRAIAVDRYGMVYAGAISGGGKSSAEVTTPKSTPASEDATEESKVEISGTKPGGKLEIIQVDKDNLVRRLYSSDEELAFDLLVRDDGSLLVATGNKGRILSISPKGFATLLIDSPEEQITKLLSTGSNLYAASSNLGKAFRLDSETAEKGTYESEVIDASLISRWGTIRWRINDPTYAEGVRLYTRSGNTSTPDRTWNDWSGPYRESAGSQIESQQARFLQWKVEFEPEVRTAALLNQSNSLAQVSVSYLQSNAPPKLASLTVHAPGVALSRFPQVNASGGVPPGGPDGAHAYSLPKAIRELENPRITPPVRKIFVPGARSFSWDADDPNEDPLLFSLFIREVGELNWRLIARDREDDEYTLDGASIPDGEYEFRVVASDRLGNPLDQAMESQLVSKPFRIANLAPVFEWGASQGQEGGVETAFTVTTSGSNLFQVEYSLDGVAWQVLFPVDGIADEEEESFTLKLTGLNSGDHILRVRAADSVGNLATSNQKFRVP